MPEKPLIEWSPMQPTTEPLDELFDRLLTQYGLEKVLSEMLTACSYAAESSYSNQDNKSANRWERNGSHIMNCLNSVRKERQR